MKYLFIKLYVWLLLFSLSCFSQTNKSYPLHDDKFLVTVGVYWPSDDYKIGVNGSFAEDQFNFDESFDTKNNHVTPLLAFHWRFTKKWHVNAEYFQLGYRRSAELQEDIEWGDYTFKAGSFAKGGIYLNMYRVVLGRTIYKSDRFLAMAGLGVHALNIKAFIEGTAYLNDQEFAGERLSVRGVAPLPNITLSSLYAFSKKFSGSVRIDWFALKIEEYSGGLWDINPTLYFHAFDHLGFFVGYNFFDFNFTFDDENWKGTFDTSLKGPSIGITSNF